MKAPDIKSRKAPERILLGLSIGLATSLCAFEYGNPVGAIEIWLGQPYDPIDYEFVERVTLEEKKEKVTEKKQMIKLSDIIDIAKADVVDFDTLTLETENTGDTSTRLVYYPEPEPETPRLIVEIMPEFPGGELALMQFLAKHTKYPTKARENGIEGTVWIQFVVEKDGSIRSIETVRTIHPWLDAEAARVVSIMPAWKAGSQQGKPMPVYFKLPFKFAINP